jgi:hypothetical protein
MAANASNPQSWNRYAYGVNSPTQVTDPSGLCDLIGGGITQTPGTAATQQQTAAASQIGANMVFPFSGLSSTWSLIDATFGSLNTQVMYNAVVNTVTQSAGGPTNLYLFSGSAGTFAEVYPTLPANIQQGITSVTYFSPGQADLAGPATLPMLQGLPPGGPGGAAVATNVVSGLTGADPVVVGTVGFGLGLDPGTVLNCPHDANCEFGQFNNLVATGSIPGGTTPCQQQKIFSRQSPNGSQGGSGGSGGAGGGAGGVALVVVEVPRLSMFCMAQIPDHIGNATT